MKKLHLKALNLGANQILSRDQLKKVFGGDGSSGGLCVDGTTCPTECLTSADCGDTGTCYKYNMAGCTCSYCKSHD